MATATATGSRSTRPARRSATRTWPGRMPAIRMVYPDGIAGARARRRCANCKAMSMTPGCAWRRSSTRSASRTAPRTCGARPQRCSSDSTRRSGTRSAGFYAYCSMARSSKVLTRRLQPRPSACGPASCRRIGRRGWSTRLMAPDMWSGWGIRTLSATHPAFNPYSYQNGSVWPHDNSLIALGFKRYGFDAEAGQVARDISEAAAISC